MKELKLPFVSPLGEHLGDELVSTLSVTPQLHQPCIRCSGTYKVKDDSPWLLILEVRRGRFDFMSVEFFCPSCAPKRLAYFNRQRECEIEMGNPPPGTVASKRADECRARKTQEEGDEYA